MESESESESESENENEKCDMICAYKSNSLNDPSRCGPVAVELGVSYFRLRAGAASRDCGPWSVGH